MRLVLRNILFPVILIMSIMLAFSKFIVSISCVVLGVIAFLVTLGSLACFVQNDPVTGIQALIIAFLLSPYGLPKIAIWIIVILSILVDTFISKISLPMQPVPEIRSISGA